MKLAEIGEFGLIQRLQKKCAARSGSVITGIGDDAAVLKTRQGTMLLTSDMLLEGVHFDLSLTTPYQLGAKFLSVNASDIYAMGGMPLHFVIGLGLPVDCHPAFVDDLYNGIHDAALRMGIVIVGGDTCASHSGIVLSGTMTGTAGRHVLTRSGARKGDSIFISGCPGDSAAGLALLQRGRKRIKKFLPHSFRHRLIKKHLMPAPVPMKNISHVRAMIDLSDGLLIDLSHICDASGVGAKIYKDALPLSDELKKASRQLNRDPLDFALSGGEDYILLFTSPQEKHRGSYAIGEITGKGRYIVESNGRKRPFSAEGYDHFKRACSQ